MEEQKESSPSDHFQVPYTSQLTTVIAPGQSLVFQGTVNPDAQHFELSLIAGQPGSGKEQILLQLCFHFEVGITVLNSFLNNEWGMEEFHSNPFFHAKPFDVRIRVHEDKFEISANQTHLASFVHRADFRQIDHIQASGDIAVSAVHWGGRYFELPYEMAFHGHALESGQRLFIYGIPKGDFTVSLVGANKDELFRLGALFSKQQVVRNAQTKGDWGAEELDRGAPFPFHKGTSFDMVILNEPVALQVFLNGQQLCTFFHRTDDPHKDYKKLRIDGAVELNAVEVSLCWETVGGLSNCCKYPEGREKASAEHVQQQLGLSR